MNWFSGASRPGRAWSDSTKTMVGTNGGQRFSRRNERISAAAFDDRAAR